MNVFLQTVSPEIKVVVIGILSILFLVLIDLVSAVALNLYKGTFDWKKFLDFLKKGVASYTLIWAVLAAIPILLKYIELNTVVVGLFNGAVGIVWALIIYKLAQSIFANFKELGINVEKNRI